MTAPKKTEQHIRDSAGRKKHPPVASEAPSDKSGTFAISGELPLHRLGFGAMQLTGRGVWGEPADRAEAIAVLRRAVELGINLIDTADSYGPYVAEELIREALSPYPAGLVIATKAGKSLVAVEVSYPPGGASAPHRHSAFVYAYVVSGQIASQVESQPERIYRAVESWYETPEAHHLIGRNASNTEPAKLLAVFIADTGDNALTIPDQAGGSR